MNFGHKSRRVSLMWAAVKLVTCKSTADTHKQSIQKLTWQVLDTQTGSRHTRTHTPDARHASSLRAKLASLQLTGNNLSFGFQFPGQTFKLQLLERERERRGGGRGARMCQNNLSIYLLSHLQSSWTLFWLSCLWHIFNCCEMDSAVCGGKTGQISLCLPSFTLPDIHREEFDMLQNCDTKLEPSQMSHLLSCHWGNSWNSRRFGGEELRYFLMHSVRLRCKH